IGVCGRLFEQERHAEQLYVAFQTAERGTARGFVEMLGRSRAQAVGGVSPELRAKENQALDRLRVVDESIREEQGKALGQRDPERVAGLMEERARAQMNLDSLVTQMGRDSPQYAALMYPQPCSLAEARYCLAENEVALLFILGRDTSYLVSVEGSS